MNSLIEKLKAHWNPQRIEQPTVDPELPRLNGLQRAVESFRYTALSLEWWLSPNGHLREWLKINGKISSVLVIPAVLIVPLVTFILWQVSKWAGWLVGITGNLILLPMAVLVAVVVVLCVTALLRATFRK
jgi:hypothetical protein